VAWRGFLDWHAIEPLGSAPAVVLETAHPAKFPEEIEKTLGFSPEVPSSIAAAEKLPEDYDRMDADYGKFREYLIAKHIT
jgi:threonine synthase